MAHSCSLRSVTTECKVMAVPCCSQQLKCGRMTAAVPLGSTRRIIVNRRRQRTLFCQASASTPETQPWDQQAAKAELAWTAEDWALAFKGSEYEYDYPVEQVQGSIPMDLEGTLFKVGPANFKRGETEYLHWLDGDGAVVALSMRGGRAHVRMRFVRTSAFCEEEEECRVLYRGTFGTNKEGGWSNNILDVNTKNTANTAVVAWGGKLLALWEAGLPHLLDMDDLSTKSAFDFKESACRQLREGAAPSSTGFGVLDDMLDGMFGDAVGAHTRIDPHTNRLIVWSWRSVLAPLQPPRLAIEIREFDKDWVQSVPVVEYSLPGAFFNPHDIILTDDHYIFFQPPLQLDSVPFALGVKGPAQCVTYDSEQNMIIHMIPRHQSDEETVVLETDGAFPIHHALAYREGTSTTIVTSGWISDKARMQLKETAHKGILGSWEGLAEGDFSEVPESSIFRYTIDTENRIVKKEMLHKAQVDHPHCHPKYSQRSARYIYFCASNPILQDQVDPPQGYMQLDLKTGEKKYHYCGKRCFTEDFEIIPKENGNKDQEEAVWLVAPVFDASVNKSYFIILDGEHFGQGPVAKIWLKQQIPHAIHGCWQPDHALSTAFQE